MAVKLSSSSTFMVTTFAESAMPILPARSPFISTMETKCLSDDSIVRRSSEVVAALKYEE